VSALSRRVNAWLKPRNVRELMPDRLLFGPVFNAQVRVQGRQRGMYVLRGLYALMLTLVVGTMVLEFWSRSEHRMSLTQFQGIAPDLFQTISVVQLIAILLVGPVSIGPSLGDEKRSGTLGALMTTPMPAIQIVCSRLSVQMVGMLTLVLMSTPILLAVRALGGVPAWAIMGSTLLALSTGIFGAALSMWISLWRRSGTAAAVAAVVIQLGIWLLSWMLYWFWATSFGLPQAGRVLLCLTTPTGLADIFVTMRGTSSPVPIAGIWVWNVLTNLAMTLPVILLTAGALRRSTNEGAPTLATKAARIAPGVAEAMRVESRASREVGDDPVRWRELGRSAGWLRGWTPFAACAAVMLCFLLASGWDVEPLNAMMMGVLVILSLVSGVATPAEAIAGERSSRSLDVLMMTPLTARGILLGKLSGILKRMAFFPGLMLVQILTGIAAGTLRWTALITIPLVMLPPLLLQACGGLLISTASASAAKAARLSLFAWLGLWLAVPVLFMLTLAMLESAGIRLLESIGGWLLLAHPLSGPIATVLAEVEAAKGDTLAYVAGLSGRRNTIWTFLPAAGLIAMCYLGVAYCCFVAAVNKLQGLSGRKR